MGEQLASAKNWLAIATRSGGIPETWEFPHIIIEALENISEVKRPHVMCIANYSLEMCQIVVRVSGCNIATEVNEAITAYLTTHGDYELTSMIATLESAVRYSGTTRAPRNAHIVHVPLRHTLFVVKQALRGQTIKPDDLAGTYTAFIVTASFLRPIRSDRFITSKAHEIAIAIKNVRIT